MINPSHLKLLKICQTDTEEEVRLAYLRAAKQNHPDLFPEADRHTHERRMMKINEAYMAILAELKSGGSLDSGQPAADRPQASSGDSHTVHAVGNLRDPGYTYYKLGFIYYKKGYMELNKRDPKVVKGLLIRKKSYNAYILKLSVKALHYFEKAYGYFLEVLNNHPESIWCKDSSAKLRRITKFSRIYNKICQNLSSYVKQEELEV
jgi:hypothetical protein